MAKTNGTRVDTGNANMLTDITDDILTVTVDLRKSFGRSKGTRPKGAPESDIGPWGKNVKVASSGGNVQIDSKTGTQLGFNVFRAPTDSEREELFSD